VLSGHRSGSTLVNMVLGSHKASASLGEFSRLQQVVRERRTCTCGTDPLGECAFWLDVGDRLERRLGWNPVRRPGSRPLGGHDLGRFAWARLRTVERVAGMLDLPAAQRGLAILYRSDPAARALARNTFLAMDVVGEVSGAELLVDSSKNPFRARSLLQQDPRRCRILFLVRDGRGVMASMLGQSQAGSDQWHNVPREAAGRWQWENRRIRRALAGLPEDAWAFLRYEDFCRDPEKELRRICSFLDVEFDPGMLAFRDRAHHDVGGNRMRFSADRTIRLDEVWRRKSTPEDLAAFEEVAGSLNRALGYTDVSG
jgi:hypothetical protein